MLLPNFEYTKYPPPNNTTTAIKIMICLFIVLYYKSKLTIALSISGFLMV